MRRSCAVIVLAVLAACGGDDKPNAAPAAATVPLTAELVAADVAVARAGCVRCHTGAGADAERHALARGPALTDAARWHADGGQAFLQRHHGGDDAPALAAWLAALGQAAPPAQAAGHPASGEARGEQLIQQLACGACHAPNAFDALPQRTDFTRLAGYLADPSARHPGLVHPPLTLAEASDVAAWLLRGQRVEGAAQPGFGWSAWEMPIRDPKLPDVTGVAPAATGIAAVVDDSVAPRRDDYVLRFEAKLDVPQAGEWTFVTGSDDSSWLWIDGQQVVKNEAIAAHRRREGKVTLTAGPHEFVVMHTQGRGDASLEALWRGPGVDELVPIPAARATTIGSALMPPAAPRPASPELVAQGRAAARARRCDSCHAIADAAFDALPPPPAAKAWSALRAGDCPKAPAGSSLFAAAQTAAARPLDDAQRLATALMQDGCLSCHGRDGKGGLPAAVRSQLVEVEDIGDEGRIPPDLTAVGKRLKTAWIEKVLRDGHGVRPYLRVRMPKVGAARAVQYAQWFAAVDGVDPRPEPAFSVEAVKRGAQLAGLGGRNCITCHTFQGLPSLGVQGMDLSVQHERLQAGWFQDWLLHPTTLRPGTRMPALWLKDDEASRGEAAAIRTWLSLGAAAPLPTGIKAKPDSLVLVPGDRPKLHGAFLRDVSARTLSVGTSDRTHFAFDLEQPRLVWLWRGEFLDAQGTWSGRAGQLLKPRGLDWIVLQDLVVQDGAPRRLLGQRIAQDGFPALRVAAGDVEYEDEARPRLTEKGSEVVRTFRATKGELALAFPTQDGVRALVAGQPAGAHRLAQGQTLEVVYQW